MVFVQKAYVRTNRILQKIGLVFFVFAGLFLVFFSGSKLTRTGGVSGPSIAFADAPSSASSDTCTSSDSSGGGDSGGGDAGSGCSSGTS